MEPVTPVLDVEFQHREVVYGAGQAEYRPLFAHRSPAGVVLSRWTLTDSEREAVAAGADVFLFIHTFNHTLQPVCVEIGECDRDMADMTERMGLNDAAYISTEESNVKS